MSPLPWVKPGIAPNRRWRSPKQERKIGSFQETRFLFLFVLLPVFCLLDFAVDTAQRERAHRYLQNAADQAAIEGAQTFARGGDRTAAEIEIYEVFQTLADRGPPHAGCMIETIDLSKRERTVFIKSVCSKRPNIGSILLGRPRIRVDASAMATFSDIHDDKPQSGFLPRVRLVE